MCIFEYVSRKAGNNSVEACAIEKVSCVHECISCLFKYCTRTGSSSSSTTGSILQPLFCDFALEQNNTIHDLSRVGFFSDLAPQDLRPELAVGRGRV